MNLADLKAKLAKPADKVPAGWKSAEQWGLEWGLGSAQSRALINRALTAGLCQAKTFRIMVDKIRVVRHFKFKS